MAVRDPFAVYRQGVGYGPLARATQGYFGVEDLEEIIDGLLLLPDGPAPGLAFGALSPKIQAIAITVPAVRAKLPPGFAGTIPSRKPKVGSAAITKRAVQPTVTKPYAETEGPRRPKVGSAKVKKKDDS